MRINEDLLRAFADGTRLRILHLLAHRGPEICVCDLVAVLDQPQGTISRHLMQLRHLGLVQDRRQGTWMHYSLAKPEGRLHLGLLRCLENYCDDEAALQADLQHFDALHRKSALACCSPTTTCAPPKLSTLKQAKGT